MACQNPVGQTRVKIAPTLACACGRTIGRPQAPARPVFRSALTDEDVDLVGLAAEDHVGDGTATAEALEAGLVDGLDLLQRCAPWREGPATGCCKRAPADDDHDCARRRQAVRGDLAAGRLARTPAVPATRSVRGSEIGASGEGRTSRHPFGTATRMPLELSTCVPDPAQPAAPKDSPRARGR